MSQVEDAIAGIYGDSLRADSPYRLRLTRDAEKQRKAWISEGLKDGPELARGAVKATMARHAEEEME